MERKKYLLFAGALIIGILLVVFLVFPDSIDGILGNKAPASNIAPVPNQAVAFA